MSAAARYSSPSLVLDAVAREVQEQQVLRAAVAEEARDPPRQMRLRLVQQHLDVEVALRRVAQDVRQLLGVGGRRAQLLELGVAVVRGGDDERVPSPRRHGHGSIDAWRATNESISRR